MGNLHQLTITSNTTSRNRTRQQRRKTLSATFSIARQGDQIAVFVALKFRGKVIDHTTVLLAGSTLQKAEARAYTEAARLLEVNSPGARLYIESNPFSKPINRRAA